MKRLLLIPFIITSLCSCSPSSKTYGEEKTLTTPFYPNLEIEGTLTYKYRYSDDYFLSSSMKMDKNLALLSLMSYAATIDENYASSFNSDIGFTYDKYELDDLNTIGIYYSHKDIGEYVVINMQMKGMRYPTYQMFSNFIIGKEGHHQNFEFAKEIAYSGLMSYLKEMNFAKPLKLWINGYSRSAAVANLLIKKIDDLIDEKVLSYAKKDVFCYTYETPLTKDKDTKNDVKNCFNFLNSEDLITYVPPSNFNFARYGIDYDIYNSKVNQRIQEFNPKLKVLSFSEKVYTKGEDGSFNDKTNGLKTMREYSSYMFSYFLKENSEGVDIHNRENYMKYLGSHIYDLYDFYDSLPSDFFARLSKMGSQRILDLVDHLKDEPDEFFLYLKDFLEEVGVTLYDSYKDMIRDIQLLAAFYSKTKFTLLNIVATASSCVYYVVGNHVPDYNYWFFINRFNIK